MGSGVTVDDRGASAGQMPPGVGGVALTAAGVWLRYGRRGEWVLEGLDVAIPSGTVSALVGPNGAGKTTLMRSWLGFEKPTRGEVRVLGQDPARGKTGALSAVAHVAQDVALYGALNAREHFDYARVLRHSFDVGLAEELVDRAHVRLDRPARKLSGGQRVQVGLAIAMGTHSKVLILDEPLANLDPLARRQLVSLLRDYAAREGATVLVSSHLASDLEGGFDHIAIMRAGQTAEAGMVAELLPRYGTISPRPGTVPLEGEVGRFHGRDGGMRALVRTGSRGAAAGGPASLEDIVLGTMAADTSGRES